MGDTQLAAARFARVLKEIRAKLADDASHEMQVKFLNALIGVEEPEAIDIERLNRYAADWQSQKDPMFRLRLVDALLKRQRPEEALPIIESLVSRDPRPTYALRLAKALHDTREYEQAEAYYVELMDGGQLRGENHRNLYLGRSAKQPRFGGIQGISSAI